MAKEKVKSEIPAYTVSVDPKHRTVSVADKTLNAIVTFDVPEIF